MKWSLVAVILFIPVLLWAQVRINDHATHGMIAGTQDAFTKVPAPSIFLYRDLLNASPTFSINVSFSSNFPDSAKTAFRYADSIWSFLLVSNKTIHVKAIWETLSDSILAQGKPDTLYHDFSPNKYLLSSRTC